MLWQRNACRPIVRVANIIWRLQGKLELSPKSFPNGGAPTFGHRAAGGQGGGEKIRQLGARASVDVNDKLRALRLSIAELALASRARELLTHHELLSVHIMNVHSLAYFPRQHLRMVI